MTMAQAKSITHMDNAKREMSETMTVDNKMIGEKNSLKTGLDTEGNLIKQDSGGCSSTTGTGHKLRPEANKDGPQTAGQLNGDTGQPGEPDCRKPMASSTGLNGLAATRSFQLNLTPHTWAGGSKDMVNGMTHGAAGRLLEFDLNQGFDLETGVDLSRIPPPITPDEEMIDKIFPGTESQVSTPPTPFADRDHILEEFIKINQAQDSNSWFQEYRDTAFRIQQEYHNNNNNNNMNNCNKNSNNNSVTTSATANNNYPRGAASLDNSHSIAVGGANAADCGGHIQDGTAKNDNGNNSMERGEVTGLVGFAATTAALEGLAANILGGASACRLTARDEVTATCAALSKDMHGLRLDPEFTLRTPLPPPPAFT